MNVEGKQACTEDCRRFLKTSETVPKPHEGSWKWSTTETKKFYVMFRNVIESYLTDFGFHGVGLNYSGLLYQILRQRCSIFFKMANLWEMNYSEFKLILPIKTDFVAWTDIAKKQEGQKLASSALSRLSLTVLSPFIRNHQFLYFRGTGRPLSRAWHRLHAFPYFGPFVHKRLLGY